MSRGMRALEVALLGAGAIGSRVAALLPPAVGCTIVDKDVVLPENLATARVSPGDCFRPKATVAAERRRAAGAVARAVRGDVRYAVRPGLAREVVALIAAVDNPTALGDLADTLWDAAVSRVPLVVVTCGNASTGGGHQVRVFRPARDACCPRCLWGEAERRADREGRGLSCAVTTAPRASADAAEAAAASALGILARWLDGDASLAGTRTQCDAAGRPEYTIHMPGAPVAGCAAPHHPQTEAVVELDAGVDGLAVGTLAARALATAGTDAQLLFGRRALPMVGMRCPRCGTAAPAPLRLLPAAATPCPVGCDAALVPLATRSRVSARELAASDAAPLSLRAFGSAPGEELLAVGSAATVRLRTRFDWREIAP